jgi:hypothetical protein
MDAFSMRVPKKVVTRQGTNVWRTHHFKKKKGGRVCDAAQPDRRTKPELLSFSKMHYLTTADSRGFRPAAGQVALLQGAG